MHCCRSIKWYTTPVTEFGKSKFTFGPVLQLLGTYTENKTSADKQHMHKVIHCHIVCNSRRLETTQMSINRGLIV